MENDIELAGGVLWARDLLVTALTPFAERVLTKAFEKNGKDWRQDFEQKQLAIKQRVRFDSRGNVIWEFASLMRAMADFYWNDFQPLFATRQQHAGVRTDELRSNIRDLIRLRNKLHHPEDRGEFTEQDLDTFLEFGFRVAQAANAQDASDKLTERRVIRWQSKLKPALVERSKAEFRNAESMRSNLIVNEYLRQQVDTNPNLSKGIPKAAMFQPIGNKSIFVPVAELARARSTKFKVELQSLPNAEADRIDGAERDDYVLKRSLLAKDLLTSPDNLTFALQKLLMEDETCKVFGSCTSYWSTLATHDALEHELLSAAYLLHKENRLTLDALRASLPKRDIFLKKSPSEQGMYRGMAVAILVVYRTRDEGYKVMFRKRSDTVAAHPGLLHVIPACMFQAEFDIKKEWNIKFCVIKEWCEELFSKKVNYSFDDPYYIYREWKEARELKDALDTGQCELVHSGVVLNLTNLRPELCCVLLIHDVDWYESQNIQPNWEYLSRNEMLRSSGAAISEYHLTDIEDEFMEPLKAADEGALARLTAMWLPTGLAALWLGVDAARMRVD